MPQLILIIEFNVNCTCLNLQNKGELCEKTGLCTIGPDIFGQFFKLHDCFLEDLINKCKLQYGKVVWLVLVDSFLFRIWSYTGSSGEVKPKKPFQ